MGYKKLYLGNDPYKESRVVQELDHVKFWRDYDVVHRKHVRNKSSELYIYPADDLEDLHGVICYVMDCNFEQVVFSGETWKMPKHLQILFTLSELSTPFSVVGATYF